MEAPKGGRMLRRIGSRRALHGTELRSLGGFIDGVFDLKTGGQALDFVEVAPEAPVRRQRCAGMCVTAYAR
jgi:hypothetical protein